MRTDQLGERAWLSLKLFWLRQRFLAQRLVQFAALVVTLLGGYALLQRGWPRLAAAWTVPSPLGTHWLIAEPMGNVLLIAAGAAVVWLTTGRH